MNAREKLVELLTEFYGSDPMYYGVDALAIAEHLIGNDVAPVRHGRWIEQEKYTFGTMYDCSICDNRILDNGHSWNYCPNCGAKMDEVIE